MRNIPRMSCFRYDLILIQGRISCCLHDTVFWWIWSSPDWYRNRTGKETMKLVTHAKIQSRAGSKQLFVSGGDMLHCRWCQHDVIWKWVGTCRDHLLSKTHVKKEKKNLCKNETKPKQTNRIAVKSNGKTKIFSSSENICSPVTTFGHIAPETDW